MAEAPQSPPKPLYRLQAVLISIREGFGSVKGALADNPRSMICDIVRKIKSTPNFICTSQSYFKVDHYLTEAETKCNHKKWRPSDQRENVPVHAVFGCDGDIDSSEARLILGRGRKKVIIGLGLVTFSLPLRDPIENMEKSDLGSKGVCMSKSVFDHNCTQPQTRSTLDCSNTSNTFWCAPTRGSVNPEYGS